MACRGEARPVAARSAGWSRGGRRGRFSRLGWSGWADRWQGLPLVPDTATRRRARASGMLLWAAVQGCKGVSWRKARVKIA